MNTFSPGFRHACQQYSWVLGYAKLAYPLDSLTEADVHPDSPLIADFCDILGVQWIPPPDLCRAAVDAVQSCGGEAAALPKDQRRVRLLGVINEKFGFNEALFQTLLNSAAEKGRILNYHEKRTLRSAIDFGDQQYVDRWIGDVGFTPDFRETGVVFDANETLRRFGEQLTSPTIARSDARACDVSERREAIMRSLYASFVFRCFPVQKMHAHFNQDCRTHYAPDFYEHLVQHHSGLLNRECSLLFLIVPRVGTVTTVLRDRLYQFIEGAYNRLSNHSFLAILIKSSRDSPDATQWALFSDLVLYAEKFCQTPLRTGYFQSAKIAAATSEYIPNLPLEKACFRLANEGFLFRDTFVLPHSDELESSDFDLLLLFEKNQRDERPLPCPACRSLHVRGNSYPSLGVKSWECENMLCPERSAFDRGNRYSLVSLVKRRAIASENDQIPLTSLRRWKLDVVPKASEREIAEMLIRHFTLHGDKVLFVDTPQFGTALCGREIRYERLTSGGDGTYERFQHSSFFSRFVVDKPVLAEQHWKKLESPVADADVYHGDAFDVLSSFPECSLDGAVTSPPYYNARSYSAWPNIYCYLYDMYNVARQVFRVLKPSTYFLFNIFDYFDNENTIVLSAMGKKRMILGAYIINLFRRIGFMLQGNTVWYKGEVEGKRNFNQGNRSPYYQFPLNSWEHILIFRKPGGERTLAFPRVLATRPVIKMVRGRNTLGHSAPFPCEIPELLLRQLDSQTCVLDPFAGTMTTARVARMLAIKSVSIDLHLEYCQLGISLLRKQESNRPLFDEVPVASRA